jgi:hypothetical protein
MLLDLLGVESVSRIVYLVLIDVAAKNGLRVIWLDVLPITAVSCMLLAIIL